MIDSNKTKTDETRVDYAKRARTFIKLFRLNKRKDLKNTTECAIEFSDYILKRIKEKNYKSPTIRKIKASLKYYFNENDQPKLSSAIDNINYKPDKSIKIKPRTSAKKYKHLPTSEYYKLSLTINNSNGQNDKLILTWIECTVITGLRPREWIQTRLISHEKEGKKYQILKVLNAKNTNERSFGKYRHIVLQDLSDEEMFYITTMMRYVESVREGTSNLEEGRVEWDKVYQACRSRLQYLDKKARPSQKRSITLYSARHQFAADLKVNVEDDYERSALMGHASIMTINISYGKKHLGKKGRFRVRPLKDDVLKVHALNPQSKKIKLDQKRDFLNQINITNKMEPKNER